MGMLAESLALTPIGGAAFAAVALPDYEANSGMFGGWTAALLLNAVGQASEAQGSISALTVHYLSRVPPGARLTLRTQRLGGGKSLSHWRCDLFIDGEEAPAATSTVVLANRRTSDQRTDLPMPSAAAPETIATFQPPLPFGAQVDLRIAFGGEDQPTSRSLAWEKELSGRAIDSLQLAFLCDLGWPRAFALGPSSRPSSTITLSLYIHATVEELAEMGDDFILSEIVATRAVEGTIGSRKDMWSSRGVLLATSEQLCWFR